MDVLGVSHQENDLDAGGSKRIIEHGVSRSYERVCIVFEEDNNTKEPLSQEPPLVTPSCPGLEGTSLSS